MEVNYRVKLENLSVNYEHVVLEQPSGLNFKGLLCNEVFVQRHITL